MTLTEFIGAIDQVLPTLDARGRRGNLVAECWAVQLRTIAKSLSLLALREEPLPEL